MEEAAFLWGWDIAVPAQWQKVRVDTAGHLQVDVVAAPAFDTHCHGWDGAAWQELRVESAANSNLRTSLYHGANQILSVATAADIADANRGLLTQAGIRGWDGAFWKSVNVEDGAGDALTNARASLAAVAKLYGYNGATWDRLRVGTPADAYTTPTFALEVMSFLMGYDGVDWNMVRVDAAGQLQVDVLTVPTTDVNCHGWDGANWQELLVESAAQKNLRVKLYDGANGIDSNPLSASPFAPTTRGLHTLSQMCAWDGTNSYNLLIQSAANRNLRVALYSGPSLLEMISGGNDAVGPAPIGVYTFSRLAGFNGATWDRLRSYPTGILKVGRAEVGLLTVRLVGVGQVGAAGARKLYWITMNPSAGASVFELADAAAPGGAVVYDHYHSNREAHHVTLDPPMEFSTGIYLETLANMTSIIFGYL